jgi:hypothetical protein
MTWHKQLAMDLALRLPSSADDAREVVRELQTIVDWLYAPRSLEDEEHWLETQRAALR